MRFFSFPASLFFFFSALLSGFFTPLQTINAAHLVGGELTYECLGGNQFEITLTVYRDCNCVSCAFFDDPAYITIFNASGSVVNTVNLFSPNIVELPVSTQGLCIETVPDVCVERAIYVQTVSLPPLSGGYQIVYQRCCRNNTIVNIVDPGGTGSTYVANVPQSALGPCNNSSPVFSNYPPIAICANSPLVFDHSATDIDGDSLVYSICEPLSGASVADPQPNTASAPPYTPISFLAPYDAVNQLGGSPFIDINPVTGELTAFPDQIGQYVVGICVSEYRDGVLLSTNLRDFQFNVTNCAIVLADANVTADSMSICLGQSIILEGSAFNGSVYEWTPAEGLSNPNALNPIANPTQTTVYTLTVINPLVGCQDSDDVTVFVTEVAEADAGPNVSICLGEGAQLNGSGSAGASFLWWPIEGLSNPLIANPIASPTQTTTYTLTVTRPDGCAAQSSVTVSIIGESTAVVLPDAAICSNGMAVLTPEGGAAYNSYAWSNGATTPTISVTVPGVYAVTVSQTVNGCTVFASDSATVSFTEVSTSVNLPDVAVCPNEPAILLPDALFTAYLWPDGSTNPTYTAPTSGTYSVTITDVIGGCTATASDTATVSLLATPQPNISGELSFFTGQNTTLQADNALFAAYQWNTGATTPAIVVNEPGTYTLTVTDANGCRGSVSVAVAEKPISFFTIPSAFSPNNDGINDDFMVIAKPNEISNLSLYVYNRWGQKLFFSNNLAQPWKGKYNDMDCEMGVYVYYGSLTLNNGEVKEFKGNVTLIR